MNKIFTSNDFIKDLEFIIGKNLNTMVIEDLKKIKRVNYIKKNFNGTIKDYCIDDLFLLDNLKAITFSMFSFSNIDIENLNKLHKVDFIQFDFCRFEGDNLKLNADNLVFNMCKELNISTLGNCNVKNIKIVGSELECSEIDIHDFTGINNLENLAIHNFKIKNIDDLKVIAPTLKFLNIDGSEVENDEKLDSLEMSVSHKEKFLRANA